MKKNIKITALFLCLLFLLGACGSGQTTQSGGADSTGGTADSGSGDNWPTSSITMLVPWSAGGGSDLSVRTLVPFLEEELGTSITVVNQTGANGWIAWSELLRSDPDGYTIAQLNIPAFYSGYLDPQQNRDVSLDDILPIANQVSDWGTMVIQKDDSRFSNPEEFIAYAMENELLAGDPGAGTNKHATTVKFQMQYDGIQLTPVHQAGWSDNYAALLGGHIDVAWGSLGETLQAYEDGEVDILCIFAPERSPIAPEIPTFNELNLGAEILSPSDRGFVLPAGVDDETYQIICDAFERAINNPEHIQKLLDMGLETNYIGGVDYQEYVRKNEKEMTVLAEAMGW